MYLYFTGTNVHALSSLPTTVDRVKNQNNIAALQMNGSKKACGTLNCNFYTTTNIW